MKTVLVFGTFDRLDDEHRMFLHQAKKKGDRLIVSVARAEQLEKLKNKKAKDAEKERLENVKKVLDVAEAYLSDKILGSYKIIEKTNPDLIVLGFDQTDLKYDLGRWLEDTGKNIPVISLPRYAKISDLGGN